MDTDARQALRLLDEATRAVPERESLALDPEYLRLVAEVEALPENQDGADKSWLGERHVAYRAHFAAAEPEESWIRSRATPPA